jgi:hypothetical protein
VKTRRGGVNLGLPLGRVGAVLKHNRKQPVHPVVVVPFHEVAVEPLLVELAVDRYQHHRPDEPGRGFYGHTAFEKDAFFGLPRIDLLDGAPPIPPKTKSFASVALKGLLDDPRFFTKWRYGRLYRSGDEESGFQAFYSEGLVDSLEQTGRYRFRETMTWSGKRWVLATGMYSGQASYGTDSGSTRGK